MVTAQCASASIRASAQAQASCFVESDNIITGITASVQCDVSDQTPADSNCYTWGANARASVDPGFEVRGDSVEFSITGSTTADTEGRSRVTFTAPSGDVLDISSGESRTITGVLPPGHYGFWVYATGNCSANATITFAPLGSARLYGKTNR